MSNVLKALSFHRKFASAATATASVPTARTKRVVEEKVSSLPEGLTVASVDLERPVSQVIRRYDFAFTIYFSASFCFPGWISLWTAWWSWTCAFFTKHCGDWFESIFRLKTSLAIRLYRLECYIICLERFVSHTNECGKNSSLNYITEPDIVIKSSLGILL